MRTDEDFDECCDGTGHKDSCEAREQALDLGDLAGKACFGCCPMGHKLRGMQAAQDVAAVRQEAFLGGLAGQQPERKERKGGRYVEVPKEAVIDRLEKAGFKRDVRPGEITYSRPHNRDSRLTVTVYTSIALRATKSRGCGEDSIKVVALFWWTRRGETKPRCKKLFTGRVFRVTSVEGVLDRMMEKARDAYRACNEWLAKEGSR
jgi:hypothetical protein